MSEWNRSERENPSRGTRQGQKGPSRHPQAPSIPPYSKRNRTILNGFQKFFNAEQAMLYNSLPSPHRREREGGRGKLRIEAGGSLGGYRKSSLVFPLLSTPYSCTVGEGCPPAKEGSALVLLSISGPPCRAGDGDNMDGSPCKPGGWMTARVGADGLSASITLPACGSESHYRRVAPKAPIT